MISLKSLTEVKYYFWQAESGGLKDDQVKRLKELETENSRLHRDVSERRASRILGQHRSTKRNIAKTQNDEVALTADITTLAIQYD